MWKWLDPLFEFAVSNARVIKDAWLPFLVWCLIAIGLVWLVEGQVYEVRLANGQSAASSLAIQLSGARSDIQDLRAQLAARPDRPDRWTLTYPSIPDEQFAALSERLKSIMPANQMVAIGYVDNPSAVSVTTKFHKALRNVGILDSVYQTTDEDPKSHGIFLYIADSKNVSAQDQRYIDAFRLSGFTLQVTDFGGESNPNFPFTIFVSYPQ